MSRRKYGFFTGVLLLLALGGCDGGLVGTSTGPRVVTADNVRVPKKISPVLPKSITGNSSVRLNGEPQSGSTDTPQPVVLSQSASKSWTALRPSLQEIDSTRISVQEMLTLLDSEYESVLQSCAEMFQVSLVCVVGEGVIEATYDESVTQQMIAIHKSANADAPLSAIVEDAETNELHAFYTSLEGTKVEFNEIEIHLLSSDSYDVRLVTSSDDLLQGRELELMWNESYDQITYELNDATDTNQVEFYNYRNNVNGQRLTVQRDLNDNITNASSFSIEFTAQPGDVGEVLYNARVDEVYISGQASDETAYAYLRDFGEGDTAYSQEIFDESGFVIAVEECTEASGYMCTDFEIHEDSDELYLSPEDFNQSVFGLGFNDIKIVDLPRDVDTFLVLKDTPGVPLWLRDQLCEGWQPVAGEVELFCFVPDSELADIIVVSYEDGELVLLPGARLVIEEF